VTVTVTSCSLVARATSLSCHSSEIWSIWFPQMFPLGLSSNVILALSLIATFSVYVIYVCCDHFFIRPWKSALRNLQGPPNQSFLWGNRKQIMAQNPGVVQEAWEEEYGHVYSFRTPFSVRSSRGNLRHFDLDIHPIVVPGTPPLYD
jgi:hypothetical protein